MALSPRRTLAALGLSPRKSLGQNFLADRNVAGKIVALARSFPPPFLEIGPGLGALTDLLAEAGAPVVAVELDRGLAAHLRDRFTGTFRGDRRGRLPGGPRAGVAVALSGGRYGGRESPVLHLLPRRPPADRTAGSFPPRGPDAAAGGGGPPVRRSGREGVRDPLGLPRRPRGDAQGVRRATRLLPSRPGRRLRGDVGPLRRRILPRRWSRRCGRSSAPPSRIGGRRCATPPSRSSRGDRRSGANCSWSAGIDPAGRAEEVPPAAYLALARAFAGM